jgi:hypothetical protein
MSKDDFPLQLKDNSEIKEEKEAASVQVEQQVTQSPPLPSLSFLNFIIDWMCDYLCTI